MATLPNASHMRLNESKDESSRSLSISEEANPDRVPQDSRLEVLSASSVLLVKLFRMYIGYCQCLKTLNLATHTWRVWHVEHRHEVRYLPRNIETVNIFGLPCLDLWRWLEHYLVMDLYGRTAWTYMGKPYHACDSSPLIPQEHVQGDLRRYSPRIIQTRPFSYLGLVPTVLRRPQP